MESLSASRLKLLSECKKQFYHRYIAEDLEYVESPFAEMGKAVHYALELYRKHYPNMTRNQMVNVYNRTFEPSKEFSWLKKQGFGVLWKLDLNKVVLGELVDVEFQFEFNLEGILIKGVIDKLELVDNTLIITDYKTNKLIEPEKYFIQLAIYDLAVRKFFPEAKRSYELFYVRHNKVIPFNFTEDFYKKTEETAHNAMRYISENKDDPSVWIKMNKKESMCNYCPLINSCWG